MTPEAFDLPRVVGLYSPAARQGKGTIAKYLIEQHDYVEVQFSTPIKMMFEALAMYAGMNSTDIQRCLEGDLKETPMEILNGLSFREFGETIGNDWGRDGPGRKRLWVQLAIPQIKGQLAIGNRVVVSDMRYENEFNLHRALGGENWRVVRPEDNGGRLKKWQSEGRLDRHPFDRTFVNDDEPSKLLDQVKQALRRK